MFLVIAHTATKSSVAASALPMDLQKAKAGSFGNGCVNESKLDTLDPEHFRYALVI